MAYACPEDFMAANDAENRHVKSPEILKFDQAPRAYIVKKQLHSAEIAFSSRVHFWLWSGVGLLSVSALLSLLGLMLESRPTAIVGSFFLALAALIFLRWIECAHDESRQQ